jgi:hypothetical protein
LTVDHAAHAAADRYVVGIRDIRSRHGSPIRGMLRTTAVLLVLFSASAVWTTRPAHRGGPRTVTLMAQSLRTMLPPAARVSALRPASTRLLATHKRTRSQHRRNSSAADRATERELLRLAPHTKLLARFVDRATGLVERNVATRCRRLHNGGRRRAALFACRVWLQPKRPSSGVSVFLHSRHHRVVVTAHRHVR